MNTQPKRTILRISVTPDFREELRQFCDEYGETYATVARTALREFMAEHEKQKPTPPGMDEETRERLREIRDSIRPSSTDSQVGPGSRSQVENPKSRAR